jgi:hypothetical protein
MAVNALLSLLAGPNPSDGTIRRPSPVTVDPMREAFLGTLAPSDAAPVFNGPAYTGGATMGPDANELRRNALGLLGNVPMPAPVRPALRTEDAVKGLLPLLLLGAIGNPRERAANMAAFGQSYLGGKQNEADQKNQTALSNWQNQQRANQAQAGVLMNTAQAMDQADWKEEQARQRDEAAQLRADQARQHAEDVKLNRKRMAFSGLNTITKPSDFDATLFALRKQGLIDPEDEPTLQGVRSQLVAEASKGAESEWYKEWSKFAQMKGAIEDSDLPTLNATRARIAKRYGIRSEDLGDAPTFQSLARQHQDEARREFDQKFQFTKDSTRQRLQMAWGNLKARQEMLRIAQQNADTAAYSAQTGATNAMTAQGNLAMRQYEAAAKDFNKSADAGIQDLERKLAGAQAKASAFVNAGEPDKAVTAQGEVASLKAQIDDLKMRKEPEITLNPLLGGMQIPNHGYAAPPQVSRPPIPQGIPIGTRGSQPPPLKGNIGGTVDRAAILKAAQDAIRRGADPAKVKARLRQQYGINA